MVAALLLSLMADNPIDSIASPVYMFEIGSSNSSVELHDTNVAIQHLAGMSARSQIRAEIEYLNGCRRDLTNDRRIYHWRGSKDLGVLDVLAIVLHKRPILYSSKTLAFLRASHEGLTIAPGSLSHPNVGVGRIFGPSGFYDLASYKKIRSKVKHGYFVVHLRRVK